MASPRTYAYIQALLKRGEVMRSVERMKKVATDAAKFEIAYAKELTEAWTIVESAADRGAVRIFARDHAVFQNPAIQSYFIERGFSWTNDYEKGSLEWSRAAEMK